MQKPVFIRFVISAGLIAGIGGCDLIAPSGSRYDKIASTYCECTARLAELNKQAGAAPSSNLNAYFQEMQTEYAKSKECTAAIVGRFGHLKPAELDTLETILSTRCPDMAGHRDLLQEMLGE